MEKQVTPEELSKIQELQQQVQQLALQLGTVEVKKIQLKEEVLKLQEEEKELAKEISEKYGKGTLDLNTGKITLE